MIWFRQWSTYDKFKILSLISPRTDIDFAVGRLSEINKINLKRIFYNKTWSVDDVYTFLNEKQITIKYKV